MKKVIAILILCVLSKSLFAEDGYNLWLRYTKITNNSVLNSYNNQLKSIFIEGTSPTLSIIKNEFSLAFYGLLGKRINLINNKALADIVLQKPADRNRLGNEGFAIATKTSNNKKQISITANTEIGWLYGSFEFIRLLQTQQDIKSLNIVSVPKIKQRVLNHWDNLNRYVERGYAGISIFNWHTLPNYIDQRYIDYARANASIGINGTVLTNVNANALVLSQDYLLKTKALADVFRPYGIKVYLTARFSAPIELGKLKTADPLNTEVQQWWKDKTKEIYQLIPDFGGFLVKANSEGQPGPQNYGRTHVDGANMLADALAPFNGIVMWRAFVYSHETPEDRFKQAYNEFQTLDGQFKSNVLVQVKNGPIDFQPREPFHPLFGAMPKTPLMMEFQLTQEYLGQGTHLVYEAPMFKEVLNADTYVKGNGSTVNKIIDGSLDNHQLTGIAGVANIGNEKNWCGHPFAQANWYAFGRLAWDNSLSSESIATEWIKQTFSNNKEVIISIQKIMLSSYEAMVNYMTPLGLHHIMGNGHHYGPLPWGNSLPRADWNPVYYHKADAFGIGFNRTNTGSNALAQYNTNVTKQWVDSNTCDERYLLWFHHVSWSHKMQSGKTLWNELCAKYNQGVTSVQQMQTAWNGLQNQIDEERFRAVKQLLNIQYNEAVWWRDACLLYFQTFSNMQIPKQYEQPKHQLDYYKSLNFPYAPGNGQ